MNVIYFGQYIAHYSGHNHICLTVFQVSFIKI